MLYQIVVPGTLAFQDIVPWLLSFLAVLGSVVVGVWAANKGRMSAKESNDTARFDVLYKAQDERINDLANEVAALKATVAELTEENKNQTAEIGKAQRELVQVKRIVNGWFQELHDAWYALTENPLPLPSDEDMVLLELTLPPHPKHAK